MYGEFDHLLHAVHNPEAVRLDFERVFGLHTVAGGEHPQWGTYNALAYFGLSYIEWIGVNHREIASQTAFGQQVATRLQAEEGAVQFALRTSNIDALAAQWRAKGLPFEGPIEASRTRPDGHTIRWRMLFPQQAGATAFKLPFWIEWADGDNERIRDLRGNGALTRPVPPQLKAVHCVVRNLSDFQQRWRTYFEFSFVEARDPEYGSGVLAEIGDTKLYVWEASQPFQRAQIESAGEAPFGIDIAGTGGSNQTGDICRMFHGLRVRIA